MSSKNLRRKRVATGGPPLSSSESFSRIGRRRTGSGALPDMPAASARRVRRSTKEPLARLRSSSGFASEKPFATDLEPVASFDLNEADDRLRELFSRWLRHGERKAIAERLGLRQDSVSKMLSHAAGQERLSNAFASAAQIFIARRDDVPSEVKGEIRELRCVEARPVLTLERGENDWTYIVNVRTGEIRS